MQTKSKTAKKASPRKKYKYQTGEVILRKMQELGVSIEELAQSMDVVYEHARGIVRGQRAPSKFNLRAICEKLKLPYRELQGMLVKDQIIAKYGDIPLELAGHKPTLEPLERVWDDLSTEQQTDIITMAEGWAKRARSNAA